MDEKEKLPAGGKRVKKRGKAPLIAVLCVVGALVIGFGAACIAASRSSEILRGTSVFAMDFGGMTAAQAAQTLEQEVVRSGSGHEAMRSWGLTSTASKRRRGSALTGATAAFCRTAGSIC